MNDYGWLGPACWRWGGILDTVPAGLLLWPRCISERHWLGEEPLPASVESRDSRRMGVRTSLPTCRYLARWACPRHTYTLEPEQLAQGEGTPVMSVTSPHVHVTLPVPMTTPTALLFIILLAPKKSLMAGGWQTGLGWSLRITV